METVIRKNAENIGKFSVNDLKPARNLRKILKEIQSRLAGVAREDVLEQQLTDLVLCKIYDEESAGSDLVCRFRIGFRENHDIVRRRIQMLFKKAKRRYAVGECGEEIVLDAWTIAFIVAKLEGYRLLASSDARDFLQKKNIG